MTTRIGLMGFGRIGRNVFRFLVDHPDLEVMAIADIDDPAGLTYLLKYDSIYGRFPKPVSYDNGTLQIGDRSIAFLGAKAPGDADWRSLGVDLVVEATGKHRTLEEAQAHLTAGARKVVIASTPEKPGEVPVLLRGINDNVLTAGHRCRGARFQYLECGGADPADTRQRPRHRSGLFHDGPCHHE